MTKQNTPSKGDEIFLRQSADEIRRRLKHAAADIFEIGKLLSDCNARLPHGRWLPWLKTEFKWSDDTARRFINTYEMVKSRNLRNLETISIDASALYLLAKPKTPDAVRDVAFARAQAGEKITHYEVKRLVDADMPSARIVSDDHPDTLETTRFVSRIPSATYNKIEGPGDVVEVVDYVMRIDQKWPGFALRVADKLTERLDTARAPQAKPH